MVCSEEELGELVFEGRTRMSTKMSQHGIKQNGAGKKGRRKMGLLLTTAVQGHMPGLHTMLGTY
jgi:hypothetical protein